MLNTVVLLGRLAEEPELKYTRNNTPVLSFDLAVQPTNNEKEPDYIPIVCWRETAEFVSRYLGKGRRVVVEGRLTARKYTDKDNKNRKAIEVTASRIHFADSKGTDSGATNTAKPAANSYRSGGFEELPDDEDDGDLPF